MIKGNGKTLFLIKVEKKSFSIMLVGTFNCTGLSNNADVARCQFMEQKAVVCNFPLTV